MASFHLTKCLNPSSNLSWTSPLSSVLQKLSGVYLPACNQYVQFKAASFSSKSKKKDCVKCYFRLRDFHPKMTRRNNAAETFKSSKWESFLASLMHIYSRTIELRSWVFNYENDLYNFLNEYFNLKKKHLTLLRQTRSWLIRCPFRWS